MIEDAEKLNLEKEQPIFPKLNKKIFLIPWAVITVILIGFLLAVWFKDAEKKIYQKGIQEGQANLVNQIINGARVNLETGVILFTPKQ